MAAQQLTIILDWENGVSFQMRAAEPGAQAYVVIERMEENSDIGALWRPAQKVCEIYFSQQLTKIGEEMKAP